MRLPSVIDPVVSDFADRYGVVDVATPGTYILGWHELFGDGEGMSKDWFGMLIFVSEVSKDAEDAARTGWAPTFYRLTKWERLEAKDGPYLPDEDGYIMDSEGNMLSWPED